MSDNKVETELLSQIKEVLLKFPKYWEKDVLLRNKVAEDLRNYNQELIEALLSNQLVKDTYSISLNYTNIFKIEEFISMLRYKNYWENSYTKYSNEIGLTSEGKYLNYNTDVVLDFPHKDSVLEGGMTKEDQGKKEIYYHNVLAKEEIDTLLSPKVLANIKKYDKNGEHDIDDFTDKDNLIIKGNNLVALHSLKERYENKIKMVYIDPPYNTGSDSFKYNDKFSRSTWLTFIKNRLEEAWNLLCNDGVLAVQCSFHNFAYLKVMMDSIFGEDRKVLTFNILVRHPERTLTSDKNFNDVVEYVLVYSKSDNFIMPKIEKEKTEDDYIYEVQILEKPTKTIKMGNKKVELYLPEQYKKIKGKPGKEKFKTHSIRGSLREKNSSGRFYVKYIESLKDEYPPKTLFKVPDMGDDGVGYRYFHLPKEGNKNGTYFQGMPLSSSVTKIPYPNFVDFVQEYNVVNDEGNVDFRNGKKPESLVLFLIKLFTKEQDIVLDFFMGSSTTQAVAHKMGRQYIGIEQMDYINTVSVPRLQKVIEGEQGGISKDVDWKGGGSFVYAELASLNERYVKDIQQASNERELEKVLSTMKESAYLNFKVDLERVSSKDEGYHALSLEERKEVLIQVLDMNQLYLSYSEIEDEQYKIPEDVKAFNHSFYQKEGVQDE